MSNRNEASIKPNRPNVLVIMTDQQRGDSLGCYGNDICQTPNLDRFASQGMIMDSAFVANSVCTPNRASLMTGRYPSAHGARCNGIPLSDREITLPQVLAANGYATGSFGKIHLQPTRILTCSRPYMPNTMSYESLHYWINQKELWNDAFWDAGEMFPRPYYGFQEVELTIGHTGHVTSYGHYGKWLDRNHPEMVGADTKARALPGGVGAALSWKSALPAELHSTNWAVDRTIDFIDMQHGEGSDGRPFCTFCSIPDPHHAFAPPEPYCNMYNDADIKIPPRREGDLEAKPPHYLDCYNGDNRVHGMPPGFSRKTPESHYREVIAHTYGMITLIDDAVGRLLKHLDDMGLADDTLVLFTSDHGDLLGDHGLVFKGPLLLDGCVRVPMIWRMGDKIIPASQSASLASPQTSGQREFIL